MAATPNKGTIFTLVLTLRLGAHGWREAYSFSCVSGTIDDAQKAAGRLAILRGGFLTDQAAVAEVSARPVARWDAANNRNVKITDLGPKLVPPGGAGGFVVGVLAGSPADPASCVVLRLFDATGLYRRDFQFRGIPASSLRFSALGNQVGVASGAPAQAPFIAFLSRITNADADPAGVYVLRGRSHDEAVTLPNGVNAAAPDVTGCSTILTLARVVPYAPGDTVHLHNARGCNKRGLNGDALVVNVGPTNLLTVKKRTCCCAPPSLFPGGTLTKVVNNFYGLVPLVSGQFAALFSTALSRRKTGANRLGPRGKARARCGR